MYILYTALLSLWVLFMVPLFLANRKKYQATLSQRLGNLPAGLKSDGRPTLWIHACSVGETLSVQPLAKKLAARYPEARLIFSTVTKTGQAVAEERFAKYGPDNVFFFPLDFPHVANKVLDFVRPSVLIIIDTEIWPNVLRETRKRNIPIIMVNGRISPKAFGKYMLVQPLMARVFENYSAFLMGFREDAARIQRLGAPPSKILFTGNLKYDQNITGSEAERQKAEHLNSYFDLTGFDAPLIVAGSTHEDEEKTLFEALTYIRTQKDLAGVRMLIAPRHPERGDAVAALAEREGFRVCRRSRATNGASDADVLLLDTVGELAVSYQFATVAFIGGSLIPIGGHSIMEPALYKKPIVVGPHMENFPGIIDDFLAAGGIVQIVADESDKEAQKQQLTEQFIRLLRDNDAREKIGAAAHAIFEGSQGATQVTVDRIAEILGEHLQAAASA